MQAKIVTLPGDGIGPEVVDAGVRVLSHTAEKFGHQFTFEEAIIGGCAIDATGNPFPDESVVACEKADAVLLGAVGGPKWSDPTAPVRPEQGLLKLRQYFDLFANLRPVKVYPALASHTPLRPDLLEGVDILFVRELTSDIYFGERQEQGDGNDAWDTMYYSVEQVQRVARVAFEAARKRRGKVSSVDKANVLAAMRLWRRTVIAAAADYPDVALEHILVDACAMYLLRYPAGFDVVLAGNMFGDILSDEASMLAGSLGMLPSASIGTGTFGVYEPIHGSAPDIAGQGIANPIATILSAAMLLRYSLGLETEARSIEAAVDAALNAGARTVDIADNKESALSTSAFTDCVLEHIR
jgi:3-isopropylmalate dehydrogenase